MTATGEHGSAALMIGAGVAGLVAALRPPR